ncbi:hypothetical protein SLEP1_g3246 [Rubroshorea leprosula]|uniref:Protein kinase domain-containing protein n=1 Tax=Rubroshorea leprosula TaxID=152421 RepID=A0AAV5HU52_9ROSI|nr:hypothetical protein SLEP1_g3246 [Rubroshorea leprosula]
MPSKACVQSALPPNMEMGGWNSVNMEQSMFIGMSTFKNKGKGISFSCARQFVKDLHALISPVPRGTPLPLVLLGKSKNALLLTFLFLNQIVWLSRTSIYKKASSLYVFDVLSEREPLSMNWVAFLSIVAATMECYEIVKDIGSGNFGMVKLVKDKCTEELFAVKFIERGLKIDEHVQREILNHRSLKHANIVRFKEVGTSSWL